jgi:hypothetical protein
MSLAIVIAVVLLFVALGGVGSWYINPVYGRFGGFLSAVAIVLLFLIAVGLIHI